VGTGQEEGTTLGCRLLRRGGVAAVGDIAGASQTGPVEALRRSGIEGVAFVEAFGMGARQAAAVRFFESLAGGEVPLEAGGVRLGLQPHAPYSAGLDVYRAAARLRRERGIPIATHLAESMAERELVRDANGPLRPFLEAMGVWDGTYLEQIGRGKRPVEHLADVLGEAPWLVVHVNDCTSGEVELLAGAGAHVVYCPRASAYFAHERELGPHRYREMLEAGINVALGTDSIVCLPPGEADRLSTLDEMRVLHRRDGTDPSTLLAMATTNGARALGMDESRFTLARGPLVGLIAVDVSGTSDDMEPAARILETDAMPEWVWPPTEDAP
jgi:cytosine/adenosine deaminase-related metal-dependent hydrolase